MYPHFVASRVLLPCSFCTDSQPQCMWWADAFSQFHFTGCNMVVIHPRKRYFRNSFTCFSCTVSAVCSSNRVACVRSRSPPTERNSCCCFYSNRFLSSSHSSEFRHIILRSLFLPSKISSKSSNNENENEMKTEKWNSRLMRHLIPILCTFDSYTTVIQRCTSAAKRNSSSRRANKKNWVCHFNHNTYAIVWIS